MEKLVSDNSYIRSFDLVSGEKMVFAERTTTGGGRDAILIKNLLNSSGTTWAASNLRSMISRSGRDLFGRNLATSNFNNQVIYGERVNATSENYFKLASGAKPIAAATDKYDIVDYKYNANTEVHYAMFLKQNEELIVQSYNQVSNKWKDEQIGISTTGVASRAKLRVQPNNEKVAVMYIDTANKVSLKTLNTPKLLPVIFVDKDATGSNNGSSWANVYTNLQDAIDLVRLDSQKIWVAAGTYLPTHNINLSTTDREKHSI